MADPAAERLLRQADVLQQELIVDCMRQEGFGYQPTRVSETAGSDESDVGYGIVDALIEEVETRDSSEADPLSGNPDLSLIPEDQLEAFSRALYGEGLDGGCEATARLEAEESLGIARLRAQAQPALTEFARWQESAEAAQLRQEWAECMRTDGFEFSDREDLYLEIEKAFYDAWPDPSQVDKVRDRERLIDMSDTRCSEHADDVLREVLSGALD